MVFGRLDLLLAAETLVGHVPLLGGALAFALLWSIMIDLLANLYDLFDTIILRPLAIWGHLARENLRDALLILDPVAGLSWGLALVDDCAVLADETSTVIKVFETI